MSLSELSKREKILLSLLVVVVLGFCVLAYRFFCAKQNELAFKLDEETSIPIEVSEEGKVDNNKNQEIIVYIIGAVKSPGVYTLNEEARVKDAIEIAGGPLSDADLLVLNLAEKLQDEDKVYIPKQGEVNETYQDKAGQDIGISSKDDGKININKADMTELETLPGIGPATAQKIIDYRAENGFFRTIDDIKDVSGIGDKKFEQIKEKITAR